VIRARLLLVIPLIVLLPRTTAAQVVVTAPPSLTAAAMRVDETNMPRLRESLERAGLPLPAPIRILLLPEDDPNARAIPEWIVGFASGEHDIVIMPGRVVSYPYDSLESVVRHEVAHLALTTRAGGRDLPRWFHEGVAVSVDAGWDTESRLRLLLAVASGPRIQQLTRLFESASQPETTLAYLLATVLVDDLRQRHGPELPGAIAARVAMGTSFDEAFRLETSETPDAAAARAWAVYRRWTAWVPSLTSPSAAWTVILLLAIAAYVAQRRRRARRRRQWDEEEAAPPYVDDGQ
jgi:hypothetical protein